MSETNVITLSGSLRFWDEFLEVATRLSMEGNLVLIPFKDPRGGDLPEEVKLMYDEMHQQRIDMCQELYVINKDGYIGKSTKNEIRYAIEQDKDIQFMEAPNINTIVEIIQGLKSNQIKDQINENVHQLLMDLIKNLLMSYIKYKKDIYNFMETARKVNSIQIKLDIILTLTDRIFLPDEAEEIGKGYEKCLEDAWKNSYISSMPLLVDIIQHEQDVCPYSFIQLIYSTSSELMRVLVESQDISE